MEKSRPNSLFSGVLEKARDLVGARPASAPTIKAPAARPDPFEKAYRNFPNLSETGLGLLREVSGAVLTLESLSAHRAMLGEPATETVLTTCGDVRRRAERDNLHVCVVGEKKAGKSTFLNALLGERVLGTAVRECTGTVTLIRHGARVGYQAEFTDGRRERLGDVFAERHEELEAAWNRTQSEYEQCRQLAIDLPRLQQEADEAVPQHVASIERLHQELTGRELAEAAERYQFETAQAALEKQRGEVLTAGQGVPYFYCSLAYWWTPWIWLPRLLFAPFCKTEWNLHLERVRALHEEDERVRKIGQGFAAARVSAQGASGRLTEGRSAHQAALDRVEELRRTREELPSRTERLRNELNRLEAEAAAHAVERRQAFLQEVLRLTDMAKRGGEVARLELEYPGRYLRPGLTVIDTPGVNTDEDANKARAWEAIRRDADGCIIISDMQQAISASTKEFVREVREVVPHLVLILTKVDRALADAEGSDDLPQDQVDEARRGAEKRFAQEVGRNPGEILSFAVAAERALAGDDAEYAERFEADLSRLYEVLNREKALMLAARAARAIRNCVAGINDAQQAAETSYRERIATLEEQRIPDPQQFCQQQIAGVDAQIRAGARAATRAAVAVFDEEIAELKERCVRDVLACQNAGALKEHVDNINRSVGWRLKGVENAVRRCIEREAGNALREIEGPMLEEVARRYRIVQQLAGGAAKRVDGRGSLGRVKGVSGVGVDLKGSVSQFQMEQGGSTAGGAAVGAAIGTFLLPGVGTVLGALFGGVAGNLFGPKLDPIKRECAAKLLAALEEAESQQRIQVANGADGVAEAMRQALDGVLQKATKRYSGWIGDLIRDEERRIAEEKRLLENLLQIRVALQAHDTKLDELGHAAAEESRGLCR